MRVLFVTNSFSLPNQPGMPRPFEVAQWFARQGHAVTVLANARHYLDETLPVGGPPEAPQMVDGMRIVGLPTPPGRRRSLVRRVWNYLALAHAVWRAGRRLGPFDVVIAGTPPLLVPAAALRVARRFGARAVLEIRDFHPHSALTLGLVRNPLAVRVWTWWEQRLRRRFDRIVAVVPRIKAMCEREGLPAAKVTVITNGYDRSNDEIAPLPAELESYFAAEAAAGRFVIGYGGNMGHSMNIPAIIAAAARCKDDPRLSFALFGEGEQKAAAEAAARAQGLDRVRFFAPEPRRVIGAVFRRCDALVHAFPPSEFFAYALPNKIFEYMGAGRPIVFGGTGDTADLIAQAGCGFACTPDDAAAMAALFRRLADDRAEAAAMGARGRAYVTEHFARERIFERWNAVIDGAGPPAAAAPPVSPAPARA